MKTLLTGLLGVLSALLALYYETIQGRFHEEIDLLVWKSGINNLASLISDPWALVTQGVSSREHTLFPKLDETSDSLRLLVIEPGHGRIRCRSMARKFDQNPQYRALSYEWGSPEPAKILKINGVMIRVRFNLWWALYQLRDPFDEVVVWVDAICINQGDEDEIGRLVPLMDMIYNRAEQVIVWLGQTEFPADVDCRVLTAWQSKPQYRSVHFRDDWSGYLVPYLYDMAHGSYWQRTWVVQEMVMATDISVWYGRCSLPWSSFLSAIQAYHDSLWYDTFNPHIRTIQSVRERRIRGDILTLVDLVSTFQNSFSQEPYDKLYAFLGMTCDDAAKFMPVSYNKSMSEVYHGIVEYLSNSSFRSNQSELGIVHRTALFRRILLRKAGWMREDLRRPRLVNEHDDVYGVYSKPVEYTLSRKRQTISSNDNPSLQGSSKQEYRSVLCWLPSEPEHLSNWTVEEKSQSLVRAKGMEIGTIDHLGPPVDTYHASHQVFREWKTELAYRDESHGTRLLAKGEQLKKVLLRASSSGSIAAIKAFRTYVDGRLQVLDEGQSARLFITDKGALGLASPQARVGDIVIQFWKSSASAIVRIEGEQHKVVGRCAFVEKGHGLEWDIEDDLDTFQSSSISVEMEIDTLTRLNLNSEDLTKRDAEYPCRRAIIHTKPHIEGSLRVLQDWCTWSFGLLINTTRLVWRLLYSTTTTGWGTLVAILLFLHKLHFLGLCRRTTRDWVLYFRQEFHRRGLTAWMVFVYYRFVIGVRSLVRQTVFASHRVGVKVWQPIRQVIAALRRCHARAWGLAGRVAV